MPVILQTGRAWAATPAKSILLRFLSDKDSQRTFVRQDIFRALNCPVQGIQCVTLFTFGETHRPVTVTCNRVSVTIRSQHRTNETTIDALDVAGMSAVTSPPADGAIINLMTHHRLVPADARSEPTTFREDDITIMIGSDLYWDALPARYLDYRFKLLPWKPVLDGRSREPSTTSPNVQLFIARLWCMVLESLPETMLRRSNPRSRNVRLLQGCPPVPNNAQCHCP
ncbi:hypothetical protein HPB49_009673 [Dermacentor silvarum]|uniref:Uncharacterized protein n=1 Tax=Dermacentor silvarum TaxID=543639 RepID=A0ACB8CKF9_DERSI|nr:hypothetical protein HPB49_009673 [Dermacentor silvarum]